MTSPFVGLEVRPDMRPKAGAFPFDLGRTLDSVVALEANVPGDAFTATTLGTERIGNGVVIGPDGLVLTIGYLITEAEGIVLTANDGRRVEAHALGYDGRTGLGLVQALEPLGLPVMAIGDSRKLDRRDPLIVAGGGGKAHAVAAQIVAREPFAGYWEYLLEEALFTAPAHPHWSGAAVIGPAGELVGVGSLQLEHGASEDDAIPLNMCVPAELLPPILDDLARGKGVGAPRPWLGVFAQEIEDKVAILGVAGEGPAGRAELRRGDVILAVRGEAVAGLADFYRRMWALGPAGVAVPLTLWRGGDVFDVEIRSLDRATLLRKRRLN